MARCYYGIASRVSDRPLHLMHSRLILVVLLTVTSVAAQSPMFRGNPAHTGVYAAPTHPIDGKLAWSFDALTWDDYKVLENMDGAFIWPTTPAVVGDRIYVAVGPYLLCLDPAGKLVYRVRLPGGTLASPAVADGTLFLPVASGQLVAVNASDGAQRWTAPIGSGGFAQFVDAWDVYRSSPCVADGAVFVGSTDGRIYAFDARTGREKWHFQTRHVVRATPAFADGRVFCGSFDGHVYALDAKTGKLAWDFNTKTDGVPWNNVQASCSVADGVVYVGSRSTFLYAIDAASGVMRWKQGHDGSWVPSSTAVRDGTTYVGQSDGNKIVAADRTGKTLWTFDAPNETFASPALAGDTLYVAGNDNYNLKGKGSLCALDAASGKLRWKLEFPASVWSSPVVANDTVYVGCADGKVYAVK